MAALFFVALALLGWAVLRAARGALRPVERLHEELTGLEGSDLSRRVTVPPTGDGVRGARLVLRIPLSDPR